MNDNMPIQNFLVRGSQQLKKVHHLQGNSAVIFIEALLSHKKRLEPRLPVMFWNAFWTALFQELVIDESK